MNTNEIAEQIRQALELPKQAPWPQSGKSVSCQARTNPNRLEIDIHGIRELTFAKLELVATIVGSKRINFGFDSWESGTEETPVNGTDVSLTVLYE